MGEPVVGKWPEKVLTKSKIYFADLSSHPVIKSLGLLVFVFVCLFYVL